MKLRPGMIILALLSALFSSALPAFAIVVGQVDTFEDGTTQEWVSGAFNPNQPTNVTTGGPAGLNDNYLRVISSGEFGPGGKMVVIQRNQWTGDYTTAGVTNITMHVKNFSANSLSLRLMIQSVTARAVSTSPIVVPANSDWTLINFSVTASSLTPLFGTAANALSGVNEVRLYHSTTVEFPGQAIAAELGVDNVRAVGTVSVSGTLTFQEIDANAPAQSVTFTFTPSVGNSFARTLSVPATGVFSLANIPPGSYTLHIKGAKYLAENVPVNAQSGNVTGVTATLPAGDANNDNFVDVFDLDFLIRSFNLCLGDTGYLAEANFNGDECADVFDLDILIRNFNREGAP